MNKPFQKYIDHTLLKPNATEADISALCREAMSYGFYSVCVNGCHVPFAKKLLKDSDVKVAAVTGFPLGAMAPAAKASETLQALKDGADEIDTVINIGALKDGRYESVRDEISTISNLCHAHGALLKLILETCLLTKYEIIKACQLAVEGGADFVKTSTGFSSSGASVEDVALMKASVTGQVQVKASGGIRDLAFADALIKAGADRLGCSASVSIFESYASRSARI